MGAFWGELPTVTQVRRFRARGESERAVRWFLTFICAVNRMRNATRLWRAGAALFDSDSKVFNPFEASSMPFDSLREFLRVNHVSKKHRADSDAWRRIAESLASGQGAVARLVHDGVGDAEEVRRDLRSRCDGQARYPLLRGPKIGPMWIRIMVDPGGAQISRMHTVPVAVDVHGAPGDRKPGGDRYSRSHPPASQAADPGRLARCGCDGKHRWRPGDREHLRGAESAPLVFRRSRLWPL